MKETYNIAVIGAGSGGLVTAAGAAGLGAKTLLIEKHKMGGDCLNTGCIPSKTLIQSAKVAHLIQSAKKYGIEAAGKVDFAAVMERVQETIRKIEPHDSPERFRGLGVEVRFGNGALVSPSEVTDGRAIFRAKKIVLATGSRPRIPDLPGLKEVDILHSENLWELRELPKRLVILGGGPIGVELAQCFQRLGSKVTLVELGPRLLPRDDIDASQLLTEIYQRSGIEVKLHTKPLRVETNKSQNSLVLKGNDDTEVIEFDRILIAAGRLPNIEALGLEKANVLTDAHGVRVDETLQTTCPNIYAVGDIAGPYLFTHTADYQARLILRNALFPFSSKVDYRVVPWCTYSDPEVAQVGITEIEAKRRSLAFDTIRYDLKDLDRAICDGTEQGFIKVITKKGSDRILGATLVGAHAGDLLHEFVFAMKHNLGMRAIASTIHAYPTLAEGPKRSGDAWVRTRLTPRTKRFLETYFRWLR